jgi:hypothetical protein
MVTLDDCNDDSVAACRSVLVEAFTVLGRHRRHLVLVGGWVPSLLMPSAGHIGSIDVDLAIDSRQIPAHLYETIGNDLRRAGYRTTDLPNRFEREVQIGGRTFTVRLDLITREYGHPPDGGTHEIIQGMPVWRSRGVDIALDHSSEMVVSGTLPEGGDNEVRISVAVITAFLVMKGFALDDRKKEKDAYDIYFCLAKYPGGIDGLAKEFQPLMDNGLVQESLSKICGKFRTIDSIGPVWAAQVVRAAGGDYDVTQRDAFERAKALFDAMGVKPWTGP